MNDFLFIFIFCADMFTNCLANPTLNLPTDHKMSESLFFTAHPAYAL